MPVSLDLPEPFRALLAPLMQKLPLDRAMASLVVTQPNGDAGLEAIIESLIADPSIAARPALAAGLWLYVDDLDRSHHISQSLEDATGSFWHGIMHRREGDFSNSHYWFRRAGRHPAMKAMAGYDAHAFIDAVEAAHRKGKAPADLLAMQRHEWARLFEWCCGAG